MPTRDIETYAQREPLETIKPELAVQIPLTIADGHAVQKGDVLGVITSSGYGRRRSRTTVDTTAFGTGSTTGKVADATLFKDGDVLKNAAGATIGTIAVGGINLVTRVITLTANAAVAVADGAAVYGSDGSEVASVIADEGSDGDGVTSMRVFIAGLLKKSKLRGLDATAETELGGKTMPGDIFKF
ncbi:MAG: hypothetical protein M3Q99_15365 [Acidobacteriota bacterium]|nr:hypothetical protein [Acidobacteriota bacterium]